VKVAGIQMSCQADGEENVRRALRLVQMAAEGGARIVCLQPFFHTPWIFDSFQEEHLALAQTADTPLLGRLREEAARLGICLVAPLMERAGDRFHYSAFVLDGRGEVAGIYRKVHLPQIPHWRERSYFEPGDAFPVFTWEGLTFGIQICWDNFFPEGARSLALQGATLILAPTAAAFYSFHKWETAMLATAVVNGLHLMRVNRAGREAQLDFYGRSFCADPEGEFLIGPVGLNDAVVMTDVDPLRADEVRREWGFLEGRRPRAYGLLTEG
jgi:N-carbamoylputrescine amidase